mgnify:CR=1 FL=1
MNNFSYEWVQKKLANERVLLIGGAGFIGSHLVDALLERGNEIIILDNFSTGRPQNLDHVVDNIELVECDISQPGQWQNKFENVDNVLRAF